MLTQENINLITVIILAMVFMTIGGIFYDIHSHLPLHEREPIYWPMSIGFSSAGGALIIGLLMKTLLPIDLFNDMKSITNFKI